MRQASSHGSINGISTHIYTPTVTSGAITLHFLITAICRTLWYKASDNRVFWFFIQWVGTKGLKSLFLALGKACARNKEVCYPSKKIPLIVKHRFHAKEKKRKKPGYIWHCTKLITCKTWLVALIGQPIHQILKHVAIASNYRNCLILMSPCLIYECEIKRDCCE